MCSLKNATLSFLALVSAAALAGCGRSGPAPADEVVILCGGSFRSPMERLVQHYKQVTGGHAALSFGQSEELLPKVKLKAAGDLFISHDPYVDYTRAAGALSREVVVGYLVPVLVTAKGNPKKIERLEDLTRPGVRVILPDPKFSTCGEMLEKLLVKKGILDAVMKNVEGAVVRSHKDVAEKIKLGARDAGVMWNGVAHDWQADVQVVPTPYEYEQDVRVAVMGLSYSARPEQVEKFLKYAEARGQEVFKEFGYVK
jgi:molybdate transport system substrate-binding protein